MIHVTVFPIFDGRIILFLGLWQMIDDSSICIYGIFIFCIMQTNIICIYINIYILISCKYNKHCIYDI